MSNDTGNTTAGKELAVNEKRKPLYVLSWALTCWLVYPFFGLKIVQGKNCLPERGAAIVAGNHIHAADPVFVRFVQKRQIYYMAKAELFKNPVVGKICRWFGAFPVVRGAADSSAVKESLKILNSGRVLGIFPEGTRSKDGNIGRGKSGVISLAYISKAPIYPFALYAAKRPRGLFKKYTIAFGEPVTAEQLGVISGTASEMREGTRRLMAIITELREKCREVRD